MQNSTTYENIQNELVSQVLKSYERYSIKLDSLYSRVIQKKGDLEKLMNDEEYLSPDMTLTQLLSEDYNDNDVLLQHLKDVKHHFDYLDSLFADIEHFREDRELLVENAKELRGFNSVAKEDYDYQNDSAEIFYKVMKKDYFKEEISEYKSEIFKFEMSIYDYMNYLYSDENSDFFKLPYKTEEDYHIELKKIRKIEFSMFQSLFFWLRNENDFKRYVDDENTSRNYLKYYLLFK